MLAVITLGVLCTGVTLEQDLDKSSLRNLLEAAYAPLQDLSCEFEGQMTYPQGATPNVTDESGLYDDFSGVFAERRDGAMMVDIYHRYHHDYPEITRETIAMIGGRCESYIRKVDRRGGAGEVVDAHFMRPMVMGSVTKLICDNLLMGFLRHGDWNVKQEGPESIDGHPCIVVTFAHKEAPAMAYRFWIDLGRGGHALKVESLNGKAVAHRVFAIELDRFRDAEGQEVWVPVSGTWESYVVVNEANQMTYGTAPTNRETYRVLRESVRVNTHLPDDRFSVKYRAGTLITDRLRRVQFQFGRAAHPDQKVESPGDVESALKEQLRVAKAQGDELKASSWERSGPEWMDWLPWLAVGCSLLLIAAILIRRRVA